MTIRTLSLSLAILAALLWQSAPALADSPQVGLTVLGATARTQDGNGTVSLPFVPLPMVSIRIPFRRFEIFAEGVPPIGPVGYNDPPDNGPSNSHDTFWHGTKLGYDSAALRYRVSPVLTFGIGDTLFNQQTTQRDTSTFTGTLYRGGVAYPEQFTTTAGEIDSSRVSGMRFEAIAALPLRRTQLVAGIAVTPSMHAVLHTCLCNSLSETSPEGSSTHTFSAFFATPETASEVDASLGVKRAAGNYTLTWGLRYVDYIAHFNNTHALADHDSVFAPFIRFERAIGRS